MSIAAQYVQAPRSSGAQCGIDGGTQEAMLLAPEGRHVYSSAIRPSPALQRSAMWYHERDGGTQEAMLLIAAPEGRHVYSSAIRPSPALQRSAMWYRWWNTGSYAFSPRGATCL